MNQDNEDEPVLFDMDEEDMGQNEMDTFESFQSDEWQEIKMERPSLYCFAVTEKLIAISDAESRWMKLPLAERKQWSEKSKQQL